MVFSIKNSILWMSKKGVKMKKGIFLILFISLLFPLTVLAGKGQFKTNVFPLPPNLSVTVSFSEPSGNNILDAEEEGRLTITIQNTGKGLIFKDISPLVLSVKKDIKTPINAVIMTSAAMDQVSTWYPDKKHSLFTYYFLKGVQGEADTNKDGIITVAEMKAYLNEHVPYMARRLNNIEQQPVVTGDERAVLVRLGK